MHPTATVLNLYAKIKAHLEEMNISSGSEASNHSCINDSVLQAEHGNERLRKGGGKRQNGGRGGGLSVCLLHHLSLMPCCLGPQNTLTNTSSSPLSSSHMFM